MLFAVVLFVIVRQLGAATAGTVFDSVSRLTADARRFLRTRKRR
jgi:hypothetical protein